MEWPFICGVRSTPLPLLCFGDISLSLFSHVSFLAFFLHTFTVKSHTLFSVSLSFGLLLTYALSSYLSLLFLSAVNKNKESEMSIVAVTYSGLNKDANLLDQEI